MNRFSLKNIAIAAGLAAAGLLAWSCGGSQAAQGPATRAFPAVQTPAVLADDPQEAFRFSVEHFWDAMADTSVRWLCDSAHVSGVRAEDVERQFADYARMLRMSDLREAQSAVRRMFDVATRCEGADTSSNVFETLMELTDRYIYDPNSPFRDEDIYGAWAARLADYGAFSPEKRSIYAHEARLCTLNERGTRAADFTFRDARGRDRHLYDVKADYVLLFFSNPGCPACKHIIETLSGELNVDEMISDGRLAVVNVYIDEDLTAWRDYMPIYPKNWYNGYDPNLVIRSETVYNVRAIPSLYLLSSDKTVLLKDAPEEIMFKELAYVAAE